MGGFPLRKRVNGVYSARPAGKPRRVWRSAMATLEEITDQLKLAVGADSGLGKSIKFDLKGPGVIYINGGTVSNEDLPADCTVIVSKEDFENLAKGQLDPTMAFMTGKLKVNGDMSVAMKLQPLLAKARG
jgi:putative sterol carrier protein